MMTAAPAGRGAETSDRAPAASCHSVEQNLDKRPCLAGNRLLRRAWTSGAGGAGETYVVPEPGRPASRQVLSRTKVPIGTL
jgi:hypothetical protein